MKRIFSFGVAAVLMAASLCIPALAADASLSLTSGKSNISIGDSVAVEVSLSGSGENAGGLQYTVTYNSAVLRYDSATLAANLESDKQLCMTNSPEAGRVVTVYLANENMKDGAVATFAFTALADGDAALSLSDVILTSLDKAGTEIPVSSGSAALTVGSAKVSAPVATAAPAPVENAAPTAAPAATAAPTAIPTASPTPTPTAAAGQIPVSNKVSDPTATLHAQQGDPVEATTYGDTAESTAPAESVSEPAAPNDGTQSEAPSETATAETATGEVDKPSASSAAISYAVSIAIMIGLAFLLKKRSADRRNPFKRM